MLLKFNSLQVGGYLIPIHQSQNERQITQRITIFNLLQVKARDWLAQMILKSKIYLLNSEEQLNELPAITRL